MRCSENIISHYLLESYLDQLIEEYKLVGVAMKTNDEDEIYNARRTFCKLLIDLSNKKLTELGKDYQEVDYTFIYQFIVMTLMLEISFSMHEKCLGLDKTI